MNTQLSILTKSTKTRFFEFHMIAILILTPSLPRMYTKTLEHPEASTLTKAINIIG